MTRIENSGEALAAKENGRKTRNFRNIHYQPISGGQNGTTITSMKTTILNSTFLLLLLCLLDGVFVASAAPSSPLMVMMSGKDHNTILSSYFPLSCSNN